MNLCYLILKMKDIQKKWIFRKCIIPDVYLKPWMFERASEKNSKGNYD